MDAFMVLLVFMSMASPAWSKKGPWIHSDKTSFNVLDYGAVGDSKVDDSQAFLKAWKAACEAVLPSVSLVVPQTRAFLLKPVSFDGPCKSPRINFQISGQIVAPTDRSAFRGLLCNAWIRFSRIDGLTLNGGGQIDGKGGVWWHSHSRVSNLASYIEDYKYYGNMNPIATTIERCNHLSVADLTFLNSPRVHLSIWNSSDVFISNLHIRSPENSPNTDGINLHGSTQVRVHSCVIGTGDDCLAISHGCRDVNVSQVTCGPGHGISIGSLGLRGGRATVEQVNVRNCTLVGSTNGVRIKTWQGGSGYARKISFEGIVLENVRNPILIDQFYCPNKPCYNQTAAVQISDVTYRNINGTSATPVAVKFACSQSVGCTNIIVDRVNIVSAMPRYTTTSYCCNAHGETRNAVLPPINCLSRRHAGWPKEMVQVEPHTLQDSDDDVAAITTKLAA